MEIKANWIGGITDQEIGVGTKEMVDGSPAAYFRKEFNIQKGLLKAELTASSKGIYYTYLNGKSTDNELFKPQWSDYNQTIEYKTFDVTHLLSEGDNCVGAIVGDGWYSGRLSTIGRQLYGQYPLKLLLQIKLTYATHIEYVLSDSSFTFGTGRVRDNDFQNGETIDARLTNLEFSEFGYDNHWETVTVFDETKDVLKETIAPPIEYHECFKPIFLHSDEKGRQIYDIKQNLAGNISLTVSGNKGDVILIRYGEMLCQNGDLYTENLRSAKCTDRFICSGNQDVFEPKFTFHGFRYFEIDMPKSVEIHALAVNACYSSLGVTGQFECDNALVNQIFKNAMWGQKSNFVGLPTDCPQRDERMGWTGDSFAFCATAMFNMDCRQFYRKYMDDLIEAQRENGAVTDVVPYVPIVGFGNNGWGDVITELPYQYFLIYKDVKFAQKYLPYMKKWVDFQTSTTSNYIRPAEGYGDWLSIQLNETKVDAMNTALYARSAMILAKLCALVNDSDAKKYTELYEIIRKNYRETFIKESTIANGAQGDYLLAWAANLADKEMIKNGLDKAIKAANNHLSCGFMSIKFLLPALCELGFGEIAYDLISKNTYPSWGYSIMQGATTIWERWNSFTLEDGFGDVGMNSFNHYSFGSCCEWIYRYVLGIQQTDILENDFVYIKPFVDFSGKINNVKGSLKTPQGKVSVEWKVKGKTCTYSYALSNQQKVIEDFSQYNIMSHQKNGNTVNVILEKK